MMQETPIYFSERDYERLRGLVDGRFTQRAQRPTLSQLERELDRAEIVPEESLPADVVAMYSTVRLVDLDTDREHVYTVVYPHEADADRGRISVLAPVGTAVLGYRAGDIVEWEVPAGVRRFRIAEVGA
jgi:regulator of nucleoside diphosphate kinase